MMLRERAAEVPGRDLCRVLVVDDEPAILADYRQAFLTTTPDEGAKAYSDLAAELFGDTGSKVASHSAIAFDLVICSQGEEAIEAVREALSEQRPFSVAFIDVRMPPGIDGVTAAERMHELDANLNTVIVTGYSDIPRKEIAARLTHGNFLYFQKPFLADEFMQLAWTLHIKRMREMDYLALNASLQDEVDRRSHEIRVALRKALEGARAKSAFLSNMSHELRTPLNAIIGFSDIIQGQHFGPISQARYVDYAADINSSAQHLLNLINDVLDFSKIEAGGVTLNEAAADMDEMIAFAIRLLAVKAEQKGIEIRHARLAEPATLSCDERRVKQVLLNLILNAIKFSHVGSVIDVGATIGNDGALRVSVIDTGIGMDPRQAALALEPFTQIDGAFTRSQEGTGLGLPISLALMKLHDGDLMIASEAGKGTTVTISFPATRVL
jgi:signal transduction histidine kinase